MRPWAPRHRRWQADAQRSVPFVTSQSTDILQPGKPWWNWFGEQNFVPPYTAEPRDEEDARLAVLKAKELALPVRSSGRGHPNPAVVPTPGIHIVFRSFNAVSGVDKEKLQVTIQPGITVGDLSRYLRTQGMSLNNQG